MFLGIASIALLSCFQDQSKCKRVGPDRQIFSRVLQSFSSWRLSGLVDFMPLACDWLDKNQPAISLGIFSFAAMHGDEMRAERRVAASRHAPRRSRPASELFQTIMDTWQGYHLRFPDEQIAK